MAPVSSTLDESKDDLLILSSRRNLSTVAGLIAWATLCFAYIRFYRACKVQGVDRSSFPWKGRWQPFTAWYGFVGSVIITLVSGFSVFLKGNWNANDFIASYIGIPIFIVPILLWKLFKGTRVCPSVSSLSCAVD